MREQWTQCERTMDSVLGEQALHVIITQTPMGADKRGRIERKFEWDGFYRFGSAITNCGGDRIQTNSIRLKERLKH